MTIDEMQHTVPESILRHIGDLIVWFALLESRIEGLAQNLLAKEQRIGQIVTAEIPCKIVRSLVVSLYKERHGEDKDFAELRKLMRRAEKLEQERNQIVHSMWAAGDTPTQATRIKTTAKESRGLHFHFQRMDEKDLTKIVEDIKRLSADIFLWEWPFVEAGKLLSRATMISPDSQE